MGRERVGNGFTDNLSRGSTICTTFFDNNNDNFSFETEIALQKNKTLQITVSRHGEQSSLRSTAQTDKSIEIVFSQGKGGGRKLRKGRGKGKSWRDEAGV